MTYNQSYRTNNMLSPQDILTIMSNDQIIMGHFDSKNPALALVHNEELDGRQYIVVPCVMLTEGVHKGSNGPIYYSEEEISRSPDQWGLRPIIIDHPYDGTSGSALATYKAQAVGHVMHPYYENGKLKAEAWLDIEKCKDKCPQILTHIEHGLPMEVSTGLLNEIILEPGTWHGERYVGKISYIRADHLAILPREQGACSISDGAGLLCNAQNDEDVFTTKPTYNSFYISGDALHGTEYPIENPDSKASKRNASIPAQPLPYHAPLLRQQDQFMPMQYQQNQNQVDPMMIATITAAVSAALQPALQQMSEQMSEQMAQTVTQIQPQQMTAPLQNPATGQPYQNTDSTGASVTQVAPVPPNQDPPNQNMPGAASAQQPLMQDQAESVKKGIDQLYNPPQTQEPDVPTSSEDKNPQSENLKRVPQLKTQNDVQPPVQPAPVQPEQSSPAAPPAPTPPAPTHPVAEAPVPAEDIQPPEPVDPMQQVVDLLQQAITALQENIPDANQDTNAPVDTPIDADSVPLSGSAVSDTIDTPADPNAPTELVRNARIRVKTASTKTAHTSTDTTNTNTVHSDCKKIRNKKYAQIKTVNKAVPAANRAVMPKLVLGTETKKPTINAQPLSSFLKVVKSKQK